MDVLNLTQLQQLASIRRDSQFFCAAICRESLGVGSGMDGLDENAGVSIVFSNIILNASHACEKFCLIKIRTLREGGNVIIEIEDNGCGIAAEDIANIFTPFYTTKPVSKGTGLGLSISYQIIVEEHRGKLNVDSGTEGNTFRLSLPVFQEDLI